MLFCLKLSYCSCDHFPLSTKITQAIKMNLHNMVEN